MSKDTQAPSGVLAAQLPAIRARRQLSAEALAKRVKGLGGGLDRAAISKIETGTRGISLDEALLLAVALDVAPLHLFVPREDAETVALAPSLTASAREVRQWVRGQQPLPGRDDRAYRTEVPDSEWTQGSQRVKDAQATVDKAYRRLRVAEARLDRLSDEAAVTADASSPLQRFGLTQAASGIDRHVDLAFERIAEAKVDLDDALAHRDQVRAEERAHDGER